MLDVCTHICICGFTFRYRFSDLIYCPILIGQHNHIGYDNTSIEFLYQIGRVKVTGFILRITLSLS